MSVYIENSDNMLEKCAKIAKYVLENAVESDGDNGYAIEINSDEVWVFFLEDEKFQIGEEFDDYVIAEKSGKLAWYGDVDSYKKQIQKYYCSINGGTHNEES